MKCLPACAACLHVNTCYVYVKGKIDYRREEQQINNQKLQKID